MCRLAAPERAGDASNELPDPSVSALSAVATPGHLEHKRYVKGWVVYNNAGVVMFAQVARVGRVTIRSLRSARVIAAW